MTKDEFEETLGGPGGFWRKRTGDVLWEHLHLLIKSGLPEEEAFSSIALVLSATREEYGD